ncbi:PorV/PorQ family protein [Niabella insulamsoli]|uniref:putative type IX sorting system protein PorV2 n=1 Tax=Niabella insulamsoli TaxID=3144874 RepID=UPI0031FBC55B
MISGKSIRIAVLFALLHTCSQQSQAQFRKYSNEFLNIGAGARGLAMGSAQVASVADGTSGYWNPAGLVNVKGHTQVNLMHSEYFAGIGKYDFANVALPTANEKRVIGLTALRFAVDDIANTLFLVNPDGSLNYNNIQTFSSADYAFLLSYGQNLKKNESTVINFGANAKVIYRNVGKFARALGFGLDAGLQIFKNQWRFGLAAKDVTSTFNTWTFNFSDKEKEVLYLTNNDIPVRSTELTSPRLTLGASRLFNIGQTSTLLAETNFDLTFDGKRNTVVSSDPVSIDPKLGLEYGYKNVFFVRGGINNFQQGLADGDTLNQKKVWIYQPSVGAGFRIKSVVIDYAFANLANQSNPLFTHIFSLRLDIDRKRKSAVF